MNGELLSAILKNNPTAVKQCLIDGADVNAVDDDGRSFLMLAISMKHVDVVKILLKHGANTESKDKSSSPLILATSLGSISMVQALLDSGAKVNRRNDIGQTALDKAVNAGRVDIVELLVSKGALKWTRILRQVYKQ